MPLAAYYSGRYVEAARHAKRRQRIVVVAITVMSMLTAVVTVLIFGTLNRQVVLSEEAASDNRTWVIAQVEVDLLKFSGSISRALRDPDNPELLDGVRRQYDILYSRVDIILSAVDLSAGPLRSDPAWITLVAHDGLLQKALPLIEASDAELAAALPELLADTEPLMDDIRSAVVASVNQTMGLGDVHREELRAALYNFSLGVFWLICCLVLLMIHLYMQGRQQARHADLLAIAVQNLRATLDSSLDGVVILDHKSKIVGANEAFHMMVRESDLTGRPGFNGFLCHEDGRRIIAPAGFRAGERHRIRGRRADGSCFPAEINQAFINTGDRYSMSVVFVRDITDRVDHEERMAAARRAAEEADEAKARFLAVMSHEMRTPLNGLISAADLLRKMTPAGSEQSWYVDIIRNCGLTALEQVNNVLQLTRLNDPDAKEFPESEFSLPQMLEGFIKQFEADAARQDTEIILAGDVAPDFAVRLALQPLRRVLSNLLSNAVKFTESGTITLRLERFPGSDAAHVDLRISVEDTGIGIASEDLDRIFRNFETLDTSYARVREGSGLGLGIAKLSAEAMGGRIEAVSSPGKGSSFTFFLTAVLGRLDAAAPLTDDEDEAPEIAARILLAEDNGINRALLKRQLEGLGVTVTEAVDGVEAVELTEAQDFDVVLMDVSMPRMNGLDATAQIRSGKRQPKIPIIAVTAQAFPEDLERFRAAGMDDVLTKPARVATLVARILHYAPQVAVGRSAPPSAKHEVESMRNETEDASQSADSVPFNTQFEQLLADLGPDFLGSLVRRFREEADAGLKNISFALENGELLTASREAHRMAGAAAALGLTSIHARLCEIETATKDGRAEEARRLANCIVPEMDRPISELNKRLEHA